MKCHKFVESARLFLSGGSGGNGCSSFRREKYVPLGGPNGGDGGDGGGVILRADPNVDSLIAASYRPHRRGQDGGHGKGKDQHGRNGKDLVLKVPLGTEVRDDSSGCLIADLVEDGAEIPVARGGRGGLGNGSWKRGSRRAIDESTPGEPGESRIVRLDLKIIADIGLVGFPNAGKSSLLSAISRAHPKVAPFPFTTLHPVLGTLQCGDYAGLTVVDIPGLIENAHEGAGLGHEFLRHVERAPFLVFVIDMAGADGRKPAEDYFVLVNELRMHRQELAERPSLVAANKIDLPEAAGHIGEFKKLTGRSPLEVSALTGRGMEEFKRTLCDEVMRLRAAH